MYFLSVPFRLHYDINNLGPNQMSEGRVFLFEKGSEH